MKILFEKFVATREMEEDSMADYETDSGLLTEYYFRNNYSGMIFIKI